MIMLKIWKSIFQKLLSKPLPKTLFPDITYPISEAFRIDGHVYYCFDAQFSLPYERAVKTITFYTEMSRRVDEEYLDAEEAAYDEVFKSSKIDIFKLHAIHENRKAIRKYVIDTDLVYKLASVVYFDANEDPRSYDPFYNQKKIELWKSKLSVNDFFYSAPVLNLIPFLKNSNVNLTEYSQVVAQIKKEAKEYLQTISLKKSGK
jgi:hypothetical protein